MRTASNICEMMTVQSLLSKDEYLVPRVVGDMVTKGEASVKVYLTKDKWSGITYREDLPGLKEAIKGYIDQGLYEGL